MDSDTPSWHARNIGEHAYCPRLLYCMQVEGVCLPSSTPGAAAWTPSPPTPSSSTASSTAACSCCTRASSPPGCWAKHPRSRSSPHADHRHPFHPNEATPMRRSYLLCYDIADPKRLRRTHRLAKSYGEPWQFSVFCCVLSAIERVRLERDLAAIINHAHDQVLIIDLGLRDDAVRSTITTLGPALPEELSRVVVIESPAASRVPNPGTPFARGRPRHAARGVVPTRASTARLVPPQPARIVEPKPRGLVRVAAASATLCATRSHLAIQPSHQTPRARRCPASPPSTLAALVRQGVPTGFAARSSLFSPRFWACTRTVRCKPSILSMFRERPLPRPQRRGPIEAILSAA